MQIDEIRAFIGREAGISDWFTITQDLIDRFADATCDHQWIHVDPARARRESPFGTTIAHGFLTVSLLPKLFHEAMDLEIPSRVTLNYGFNRLRFVAPVPCGARIRAHITPAAVKDLEGGVELTWNVVVELENQPKPALVSEWLIRVYHA